MNTLFRTFIASQVRLFVTAAVCVLAVTGDLAGAGASPIGTKQPEPQCGHWALLRSCELLGVPIQMDQLMSLLPPSERGHSMLLLKQALTRIGLRAEGRSETFGKLAAGTFPAIVHLSPDHFVVVVAANERHVTVFDGEGRRRVWFTADFRKRWTSHTLKVWRDPRNGPLPLSTDPAARSAPRIQWTTLLIDRGEVAPTGQYLTFVFPFRSAGNSNLLIKSVQTSCGCMGHEKPQQPLPPGADGAITLKYDVPQSGGPFSHTAAIVTNDPLAPIVKLTASGNVATAFSIEPEYLNLGRIVAGSPHVAVCHITYRGDDPFRDLTVSSDLENATVKYSVLTEDDVRQRAPPTQGPLALFDRICRVQIQIAPKPNALGLMRGSIYLHTSLKDRQLIKVPLTAHVVAPVTILPVTVYLGEIQAGESIRRTVKAFRADGRSFRITSIDAAQTGLRCSYPQQETGSADIVLEGEMPPLPQAHPAKLIIHAILSDTSETVTVTLPLYAAMKPPPPTPQPD